MPRNPLNLSRRQLFLLAGSAARVATAAGDFWDAKPATEWSVAEIYQLMNRSPWAKPVRGFFPPEKNPQTFGSIRLSKAPLPESGPQGVVTWESSQPIRDALKTPLPDVFAGCYVIGVDGIPWGGMSTDKLKMTATLHSRGGVKWTVHPQVVRELVRASPVYAIGFSRAAAPIGLGSAEVMFEAQFERWLVESKFEPRKMLYHGQLAV